MAGSYGCAQDSQFDPIELLGSQIPFMDPFTYDDKEFQASGPTTSRFSYVDHFPYDDKEFQASGHTTSLSSQAQKACQLESQEPESITDIMLECMPLQRTPSFPSTDKDLEPQVRRARLSPHQAIRIFMLRRTKTKYTAAMLAAKYGITPKAIRDIWTRKSWVRDTRPYWTTMCNK